MSYRRLSLRRGYDLSLRWCLGSDLGRDKGPILGWSLALILTWGLMSKLGERQGFSFRYVFGFNVRDESGFKLIQV